MNYKIFKIRLAKFYEKKQHLERFGNLAHGTGFALV
jgi:hypothetical protein